MLFLIGLMQIIDLILINFLILSIHSQNTTNLRKQITFSSKRTVSIEPNFCHQCHFSIKSDQYTKFLENLNDLYDDADATEAVHFYFSGLNLENYKKNKSNNGIQVFDPNWWLWTKNRKHFVFTLPLIDVDILSLGMSFKIISRFLNRISLTFQF